MSDRLAVPPQWIQWQDGFARTCAEDPWLIPSLKPLQREALGFPKAGDKYCPCIHCI